MSKLLEIFGKAVTVNTADLIWYWLNAVKGGNDGRDDLRTADFNDIVELIGKLELTSAEEKLKFYLFENPNCAHGRLAMVAVHLHRNDIPEALEELKKLCSSQPSNTMALYAMGYCNERIGDEAKAMEAYQDCLKFKGFLQLPRQRLAAIHLKNGRIDKAICEYEQLTDEHPEETTSRTILGYLYAAEHRYDEALEEFNMSILSHPDNFHDDNAREEEKYIEEGDLDAAMKQVEWLIEQVGDQPDLYVRMGDIHEKAGRADEALACYETAIRNQPNYLEATIKLGTYYLRQHQSAMAAEQFNRAIEINDEIVDSYIGLATADLLRGKTEDAYRTLSLAAAIQQNSTMLFSETATLHLQVALNTQFDGPDTLEPLGVDIRDVIEAHAKEIEKRPRNADIHYKYGILMMVANNIEQAIKAFKAALEINPTHYRAQSKLAICMYEIGQNDDAAKIITSTKKLDLPTLNLHYKTAILFCDKNRFASALSAMDTAYKANYAGSEAVSNVEFVLENIGLVDRAIATWDRLTETAKASISERYQ